MRRQRTRSCEHLRSVARRLASHVRYDSGDTSTTVAHAACDFPPTMSSAQAGVQREVAPGVIVHEYVEHYHRERNHQVWLATRGNALKPSRRDAFTGRDPARRRRRRGHDRRVDDGHDRRQGAARRQSRRSGRGEIMGLSGFPNAETLNMTRSYADDGRIGQPRLEENRPCVARRRQGVVSDQARLRTGVDQCLIMFTSLLSNVAHRPATWTG